MNLRKDHYWLDSVSAYTSLAVFRKAGDGWLDVGLSQRGPSAVSQRLGVPGLAGLWGLSVLPAR